MRDALSPGQWLRCPAIPPSEHGIERSEYDKQSGASPFFRPGVCTGKVLLQLVRAAKEPVVWFVRKQKLLRLERMNARLANEVAELKSLVASALKPNGPDFGAIIGSMLETQGKQFTSAGEFLRTINDIAIARAGAALGQRGGRVRASTAKRDKRGRMLPAASRSDCPLCEDALTTNFSVAQFNEHQSHKGMRTRRAAQENERAIEPEYRREPEPEPTYPLPFVDLSGGLPPGGASGGNSEGEVDHGDHVHKADGSVVRKDH